MSLPLILGCLWVLAATLTAMLPMRLQYGLGGVLLVAALPLLGWIGARHGYWLTALCLLAVLSMFRMPLIALVRRLLDRGNAGEGRA